MKSNVIVRSNVYIRSGADLERDSLFISQVRGRVALWQLLQRVAPGTEPTTAARRHLNETQLSQVAWQARCAHCGASPEGPVVTPHGIEVEFRCPRAVCHTSSLIARTIAVDVAVLRESLDRFRKPISDIVQDALRAWRQRDGEPSTAPPGIRVSTTIRLTLTQHHFLSDACIEHALRLYLSQCRCK
jgi:hypothetical protein